MTFLPIVARELRMAARRRRTYLWRVLTASASVITAGLLLPLLSSQFAVAQGKVLFSVLSAVAFGYCLLTGARSTSDCISAEKREGTIGLLFLTDLKGYDVILGKVVSSSLDAVYGLVAIVPVLALALLMGGVLLSEVGRIALLFLNTLFFSVAAGVFVSTLSQNDRRAMFAAVCLIGLVCAGPFWVAFGLLPLIFGGNPVPEQLSFLLLPSPFAAFEIARSSVPLSSTWWPFYGSLLATHLIAWALLALASIIVPRVCLERPAGRKAERWLQFQKRWSYGSPGKRAAFRRRLLDINAFYWLAARDRIKSRYVWFFAIALIAIWGWSGWMLSSFIFDWDVSFWLLFLLFGFLKVWIVSEVCSRLVEDRANGSFEVLLSSPMQAREIARGETLALDRQFRRPVLALLALTFALGISGCRAPRDGVGTGEIALLFSSLMILLVADLVTLKWLSMWHSLTTNQIHRASLAAMTRGLFLPTVVFVIAAVSVLLLAEVMQTGLETSATRGWAAVVWLSIGLLNDCFFGLRARWRFLHHFREVATHRFDAPNPGLEPIWEALASVRRRFAKETRTVRARPPRGPWWSRWWVVGPAIVTVAIVLPLSVHKHGLGRQVRAKLAEIKAAGAPTSLAELQASLVPAPPGENAGELLERAAPLIRFSMQLPKVTVGNRKVEWPGPLMPLPADYAAAASNLVGRSSRALDLLHDAARLPKCSMPVNWTINPVYVAPMFQVSGLQTAPQLLQLQLLLAAEAGDDVQALETMDTLLGLARVLTEQPFFGAQQLRQECLFAALRSLERLLNRNALTPQQLRQVRQQLRAADSAMAPALQRMFVAERCLVMDTIAHPRRGPNPFRAPVNGVQEFALETVSYTQNLLGISDEQLIDFMEAADTFIANARQLGSGKPDQVYRAKSPARQARVDAFTQYWTMALSLNKEMLFRLRATQLAVDIEEFRAEHNGDLPAKLTELTPKYVTALPQDPFGSESLVWKRLGPGYVVFSLTRGSPSAALELAGHSLRFKPVQNEVYTGFTMRH